MCNSFDILFSVSLPQFKHSIISFILVQYFILFDFILLAPTRPGTCTDLHARSPIRRLSFNFAVADSDTELATADKRSFCRLSNKSPREYARESMLARSLSLRVQVKILFYFFPTGNKPVLRMLRYEVKCLNYGSWESRLLHLVPPLSCSLSLSVSLSVSWSRVN